MNSPNSGTKYKQINIKSGEKLYDAVERWLKEHPDYELDPDGTVMGGSGKAKFHVRLIKKEA